MADTYSKNITFDGQVLSINRNYKDISFTMFKHPMNKDVGKKTAASAVKQSIEAILRTSHYERPYGPHIGSGVKKLLFEPMDDITAELLKTEARTAVTRLEPRASILDTKVTPQYENNRYVVRIIFSVESTQKPEEVEVMLDTPATRTSSATISQHLFAGI